MNNYKHVFLWWYILFYKVLISCFFLNISYINIFIFIHYISLIFIHYIHALLKKWIDVFFHYIRWFATIFNFYFPSSFISLKHHWSNVKKCLKSSNLHFVKSLVSQKSRISKLKISLNFSVKRRTFHKTTKKFLQITVVFRKVSCHRIFLIFFLDF